VKLFDVPAQPFIVGVTVIVDTSCAATFAALNAAIVPVPAADKPVLTLLFIQLKVAPVGVLEKLVAATALPAQTVWLAIALTEGVGLTVIVKLFTALAQPLKFEVKVIFDTSCVATFAEIKDAISPMPEAAKPVAVLPFDQLKVAPEGALVNAIIATRAPEQTTGFIGEIVIVGVGLTVKVTV
jgi:hypothetical protein